MKTVFERIIDGELPAEKIYENDDVLVIKDKFPKAPIHLLIITKKPIANIQALQGEDFSLIAEAFRVAQSIAKELDLEKEGYRILLNNGPNAGQEIQHLHFHLLAGRHLGPMG